MLKKNKSIALVMILALLIITSSCAPKNTQAEIDVIAKTAMDLLVRQMDEQKKRAPKPLGEPIHKQITPILIRRNTTQ